MAEKKAECRNELRATDYKEESEYVGILAGADDLWTVGAALGVLDSGDCPGCPGFQVSKK